MVANALALISVLLAQHQFVVRLLDSEWSRQLWMAVYWVLPKVFDLGNIMRQIILYDRQVDWMTPVWTSALFGIAVLSSAVYIFQKRDY
jgi:hypothetical protein